MTEIIDSISKWSVLKWVILVLIAGFIGQFGKMMAQAITGKIRMTRSKKQTQKEIDFPSQSHPIEKTCPDKKVLKIMAKESKKRQRKANKTHE